MPHAGCKGGRARSLFQSTLKAGRVRARPRSRPPAQVPGRQRAALRGRERRPGRRQPRRAAAARAGGRSRGEPAQPLARAHPLRGRALRGAHVRVRAARARRLAHPARQRARGGRLRYASRGAARAQKAHMQERAHAGKHSCRRLPLCSAGAQRGLQRQCASQGPALLASPHVPGASALSRRKAQVM